MNTTCRMMMALVVVSVSAVTSCAPTSAERSKRKGRVAGHAILRSYSRVAIENHRSLEIDSPLSIFEDRSGMLWISTLTDLLVYNYRLDSWTRVDYGDEQLRRSMVGVVLFQTRDNRMWLRSAASRRLVCYDGAIFKTDPISNRSEVGLLRTIFPGSDSTIWFVSIRGLMQYDGEHWSGPFAIPDSVEQTYWKQVDSGAELSGLEKLQERIDRRLNRNRKPRESIGPLSSVLAGIEDRDGVVWLATPLAILSLDPVAQSWAVVPLPPGIGKVFNVYVDRTGRLWFWDSIGNASVYNKTTKSWTTYNILAKVTKAETQRDSFGIHAIYQDRNGQVFFGTEGGLVTLLENESKWVLWTQENSGLPDTEVTSILEDSVGRVWMGTGNGVVVLEP